MKQYSANVTNILSGGNISPYFLVSIEFSTGTIYHTNTPMDIIVPEIGTFSSANNLIGIDAPRMSSTVDRESYKITYSDNNFSLRALFEAGIIGTPVTVYIGFYNSTATVIGGVQPGQPFPALNDLIIAYKGFVDTHGHGTDTEGGVTAVIECSSPMASLDLTKPFYTSRDSMHQLNATDTSFDDVYSGSQAINLLWGKR